MRDVLIAIILIIFLCFLIPFIFTIKFETKTTMAEESQEKNIDEIQKVDYDYGKYNTIKLLHKETGQIENINLDEYLYGVVSSEMPANFEQEALKAQAVVARTYTIYQITKNSSKHQDADICDDYTCCQAWISKEDRLSKWEEGSREANWNKIVRAVEETEGKIVVYDNMPINAFFHSNSGGKTEIPLYVWGGSGYPYLQVVETSGEENYSQYSSEVIVSKEDLIKKMKEKYNDFSINFEEDDAIKIKEYTESRKS